MKKLLPLLLCLIILLTGCESKNESPKKESKKVDPKKEEVTPLYKDLNDTPISIYQLNGNTLNQLTTLNKKLNVEEDVGIFQVYFSKEATISLDKSFAESYYEKFNEYHSKLPIKVGFNLKFHLNNGEDVSYNMLYPSDCMNKWEWFMNYMYDDYANRGKGFYSHIENNEYTENTLFTAIKLQSSYQIDEVDSKIQLTVFTYDTDDDFDENGEYRGNSSYTMTICPEGRNC